MTIRAVPIDQIVVPDNRQRTEFDPTALMELAASIEANQLIHAPMLRSDGKTLVVGERRLRAIREHFVPLGKQVRYGGQVFPVGMVPVILTDTEDPLELEAIELAENVDRRDLTWQEVSEATARLHKLKQAQAVKGLAQEQPEAVALMPKDELAALTESLHSVADTARLVFPKETQGREKLGAYHTQVRERLIVAEHLDKPEVRAAPTIKDAFKVIKRLEDTERNRALAIAVGETFNAGVHQIYNADCLTWMADPAWAGKFDVICTDPLYGMGADGFGDAAGKLLAIEHHYDDSYENWQRIMKVWPALAYQVAKLQAHAYVWCDFDRFHELKGYMQAAGWYVFRTPILSYKINSGRVPLPDKGPRRQYETCLYAIKGDKVTTAIYSDVIPCEADDQMGHGAQKPVALFENLLKRSVRPGDWVLDAFAGTGTLLQAAHNLKCIAVCVELNQASYGKCLERAQGLDKQGALL